MTRLHTLPQAEATAQTAELFASLKRSIGKVPNLYATIGTNAPAVLAHTLQTSALLKQSELTAAELEAINLTISQLTGCDYCLAAHTLTAKHAGYSVEQTVELRHGSFPENNRIDALLTFVRTVHGSTGTLPSAAVEAVRAAGYSDRQIIEALQAVSAILFTNMVNRVNDTTLDFPPVS
jgi:uncharacterized peroxidase-related enzyme